VQLDQTLLEPAAQLLDVAAVLGELDLVQRDELKE
jgi:hypothetical protein